MMNTPSKNKTIRFFEKATGTRKKVTREAFEQALISLEAEVESGFTAVEIEILVSYIVLGDLTARQFCALIRCLVPTTSVSQKATRDVLTWIISYFRSAPVTSVITALQWISGLIEYKLADCAIIDGYYEFFFILQRIVAFEPHACKIIYFLTKPDDVVRYKVQDALKCYKKNKGNHTVELLSLYKKLKPELVPETIKARNLNSAFKRVPWLTKNFQLAQLRNNVATMEKGRKRLMWDDCTTIKRAGKRARIVFIPPVNYIQVGSRLYEKEKKLSVLEFQDVVSVGCNLLSLEPPCNVMAFLANTMGHNILVFGDEELQTRFSITLHQHLDAVFHQRNISYEDKECLLKQLVALENYMQQGIPVVSSFLADYLTVWDGDDFQQYIFKLLERITFDSFEDLKYDILCSIHTLFFTSNIERKCLIIATMRRLVLNMFRPFTSHDAKHPQSKWDASNPLPQVIAFVENLCSLGIIIEAGNIALLDECFTFYEMVSHVEESSSLAMFTLIPPGVLYRGLFSRIACFIERVCSLMLRYKTHVKRLRAIKKEASLYEKYQMAHFYANDVLNCLCKKKIISSRKQGHIFKETPQKVLNTFLKQVPDLDKCFSVFKHIALCQRTRSTDESNKLIPYSLRPEDFPNICAMLKG